MSDALKQELSNMIGPAQWFWLKPHVARDAIVIVNPQLDLAEVGVAISTDQVQQVQRWIGEQLITKPTVEQLQAWERDQAQHLTSLIVQPYVLVQTKAP
ncbi:MAG: DUF2288 domain-containing protein [Cyanobacteria bacterium P01_A01_bin.105]